MGENASFTFDFQVWRPSPTVSKDGCYSLVNNYIVRSTSLPVDPKVSHVARVTPLPQNQLQFQPGDVLGFYVESHGTSSDHDNGVVFLNDSNHASELVWHARIDGAERTSQSGSCPYPVGTNGVLQTSRHVAPVISLSTTVYSCTPSTTPHSSTTFIVIQSTPTKDVYPGNRSSTPSATSLRVLILGVTFPAISLVGGIVTVTVLVTMVIRMRKTSTNARHESDNNDQLEDVQHVYDYPAINSAQCIKLKSNVAYATHSDCNDVSLKPNVAYATHSTRL